MPEQIVRRLVWSHSRARAFRGCLRAYWYTYYGSWGGWERDAPPERRDAWLQKKLTTRAAWIGTLVHEAAQIALERARRGEPEDLEAARSWFRERALWQVEGSRSGTWVKRTKRDRMGFREHHYAESLPENHFEQGIEEIQSLIEALHAHPVFRRMLQAPHKIAEIEQAAEFSVDDAPARVALDVMMWDGQGGAVIVDWKTGSAHDDSDIAAQLGAYGLYATLLRNVPAERIVALHVNVRSGEVHRHPVGPEAISEARARIVADVSDMRQKLSDVSADVADPAAYPLLAEGDPACGRCVFKGLCGRAS